MIWKKIDKALVKKHVRPIYQKINKNLHGSLDVFRLAGQTFTKERAPEAAASMAYFTFFSLFPLILVIISFASFILKSQFVQDQVFQFIIDLIPISPDIIVSNIENVLTKRGAVGWLAIVGLIWSATTMFNIFALNVDRAWSDERSHNFFERRLIGIIIIVGLSILILILWGFNLISLFSNSNFSNNFIRNSGLHHPKSLSIYHFLGYVSMDSKGIGETF